MSKKLTEPRVVTDNNNDPVCILPMGFDLTDERRDYIWSYHEEVKRFISHAELLQMFKDEPALVATQEISEPNDQATG